MDTFGCRTCGWFPGALDAAAPDGGWCKEHDPASVPAPKSLEELDVAQFAADTRDLLTGPQGSVFQRWLFHVIDDGAWCRAHAQVIDWENANRTHHLLGRASVGIQLRELVKNTDPHLFISMLHQMADAGLPPQPRKV